MLFNSQAFIILFMPLVLAAYYAMPDKGEWRLRILLAASFVFYALADFLLMPVFLFSLVINHALAGLYDRNRARNWIIPLTVTVNIILLCYFKYSHFIIDNITILDKDNINFLPYAMPLGISFFTFQQISYLMDLKRDQTRHVSLREYSFLVAFFPHLIAGPLLRAHAIIPQLREKLSSDERYQRVFWGLSFFLAGLIKKILADEFARMANPVFDQTLETAVSAKMAWTGITAYTLQIYFDFSGYTDMAIGVAYLFGIRLPINFNSPYKATSIRDFWRRWHITLSEFLKDYLYIPLGGSRCSFVRQILNIMITFVLCGLWHGAGWVFIIWGALHGVFLVINHIWSKIGFALPRIVAWALTLPTVALLWGVFRVENMDSFTNLFLSLGHLAEQTGDVQNIKIKLPLLIIGILACLILPNSQQVIAHARFKPYRALAILMGIVLAVLFLYLGQGKADDFIYFGF